MIREVKIVKAFSIAQQIPFIALEANQVLLEILCLVFAKGKCLSSKQNRKLTFGLVFCETTRK